MNSSFSVIYKHVVTCVFISKLKRFYTSDSHFPMNFYKTVRYRVGLGVFYSINEIIISYVYNSVR